MCTGHPTYNPTCLPHQYSRWIALAMSMVCTCNTYVLTGYTCKAMFAFDEACGPNEDIVSVGMGCTIRSTHDMMMMCGG